MKVYNGMEQAESVIVSVDFYMKFWVVHHQKFSTGLSDWMIINK
jgi:hypothetical protein